MGVSSALPHCVARPGSAVNLEFLGDTGNNSILGSIACSLFRSPVKRP